jgi:hypothetical protein
MILYEVTLQVEPALAPAVAEHMRRQHIPAIFATGCFRSIHFDQASAARFRTCYEAKSQADLDRYLKVHAPAFRAELQTEFPAGIVVTRETWAVQAVWS